MRVTGRADGPRLAWEHDHKSLTGRRAQRSCSATWSRCTTPRSAHSMASPLTSPAARPSRCSAPTGPGSPPRSTPCSGCARRPPARCRCSGGARRRRHAGKIGGMLQTSGLPEPAKVGELVRLFRQLYRGARSQRELLDLAGLTDLADRGWASPPAARYSGCASRSRWRAPPTRSSSTSPPRPWTWRRAGSSAVAADHRRAGHHGAVRHPLPAGGRRERQPDHRGQPGPGARRRHAGRIKASTSTRTLRAVTPGPDPATLLTLPGVAGVGVRGDGVTIRTTDADATLPAWYGLGRPIHGLEIGGGGLEEALLALTGTGGPGQEAGAETGARAVASPADAAPPHADNHPSISKAG